MEPGGPKNTFYNIFTRYWWVAVPIYFLLLIFVYWSTHWDPSFSRIILIILLLSIGLNIVVIALSAIFCFKRKMWLPSLVNLLALPLVFLINYKLFQHIENTLNKEGPDKSFIQNKFKGTSN